ncbi:helicase SWR1-like [Vespula squamosa]|uniref:Helicase SWR1-like n=1 Tax=Vespula squamosa TaxID=30214 RepID=A0ABD2A3Y7_VESSQ
MRLIHRLLVLLFLREAFAAVARKPPAFSKPVYSSAYLPAAMQVIFHAVEQLKAIQTEGTTHTTNISSSTIETNQETTLPMIEDNFKETEIMEMAETATEMIKNEKVLPKVEYISTLASIIDDQHQESPETHEETPEMNYATPETNYERPEIVEQVKEMNQELPEINEEESNVDTKDVPSIMRGSLSKDTKIQNQPSIDSIVEGIYEIIKPTSTDIYDDVNDDNNDNYKMEKIEEEDDENRFTMLGEKVTQVPRPSLSNYLKRVKAEPRASLVQLASLYDALGKDARKQGYGKYFGYSDEVLQVLDTSAEGGIGPQLKKLLDNVLERNELTREDAKNRTKLLLSTRVQTKPQITKLFPIEEIPVNDHQEPNNSTKLLDKLFGKLRATYNFVFRKTDNNGTNSNVEKILAKDAPNPDIEAFKLIWKNPINSNLEIRKSNAQSTTKEPVYQTRIKTLYDAPRYDRFEELQPLEQLEPLMPLELDEENEDKKDEDVEFITPATGLQFPTTIGRHFVEWLGSLLGLSYGIYAKLTRAIHKIIL